MTGHAVGGLYEVCIGVPDLIASSMYFERFGYRILDAGQLDAAHAEQLYGWRQNLRSLRLAHHSAQFGLVRLMEWETPRNDGLGMTPMRSQGTRWSAQHTPSISGIRQHALLARQAGMDIAEHEPAFITMSKAVPGSFAPVEPRPFIEPFVQALEYTVLQPLYRQVFFERFGYGGANYRTYSDSLFRTTQIMHAALVISSDDHAVLDFYDQVLGAHRGVDLHAPYESTQAARKVFDLQEGEEHWHVDFEHPANANLSADQAHPGRIKCFRFPTSSKLADRHEYSRPSCLGYSAYSWQIRNVGAFAKEATAGGADLLSEVERDEFGNRCFVCRTPDGYHWVFLEP